MTKYQRVENGNIEHCRGFFLGKVLKQDFFEKILAVCKSYFPGIFKQQFSG